MDKTIEEKEKLYDEIYLSVDNLVKEENPCKIDSNGVCIRERVRFELFGKTKKNNCCGSPDPDNISGRGTCRFLDTSKGCTVKSLECSLWFCSFIRKWYKGTKFLESIDSLQKKDDDFKLLDPRKPKEYTIEKIKIEERMNKLDKQLYALKKKYE